MSECSVCLDARRPEIDAMLLAGAGRRTVAHAFPGISPDAVHRHAKNHLRRPEPDPGAAEPVEPARADAAEPEADEIGVVAEPFKRQMGDFLADLPAGRILMGASLAKVRAAGAKLREPTEAELRQHRATLARRDMLAPGLPPPPPLPRALLRVPDEIEARRLTETDPLAIGRARDQIMREAQAATRAGCPPGLMARLMAEARARLAEATPDRGKMLIAAIEATNRFIELQGLDLEAAAMRERQVQLAAAESAAPRAGFSAKTFVLHLGQKGVTLTATGSTIVATPANSLTPSERRTIQDQYAAVLEAVRAEVLQP